MDYSTLIKDAWTMTWRHRFLWVLGLFAGSGFGAWSFGRGGSSGQYRAGDPDFRTFSPEVAREMTAVGVWLNDRLALVIAAVVVLAIIGLAFVAISFIAQGGMARATAELAQGRTVSSGAAWRNGLRLFWRYVGLWLTCAAVAVAIAAVVAAVLAIGSALVTVAGQPVGAVLTALGVVLGVVLALAAIPAGIAASAVLAYAQRAIAVEDVGPIAALVSGWRLLRSNLGTSAVVWLIGVGLGIGVGLAIALAMVVVGVVLVAVGAVIWTATGLTVAAAVYGAVALAFAVVVLGGLVAIANTYSWSYWTTAYLRLSGRAAR